MKPSLRVCVLVIAVLASGLAVPARAADPVFTQVVGMSTKTGYRAVFAWEADQVIVPVVRYGACGSSLDATTRPGRPDTAGVASADLPGVDQVCFRVVDQVTGAESAESS